MPVDESMVSSEGAQEQDAVGVHPAWPQLFEKFMPDYEMEPILARPCHSEAEVAHVAALRDRAYLLVGALGGLGDEPRETVAGFVDALMACVMDFARQAPLRGVIFHDPSCPICGEDGESQIVGEDQKPGAR